MRLFAVVIVAVVGLIAVPASNAAAALLSGTVSGQPLGKEREPVAGVQVTVIRPEGGESVGTTTTSAKGNYSLFVPEGLFDVRFEPPEESGFQGTTTHEVDIGKSLILNALLAPSELAHLTGILRDAAGNPIAGTAITMTGSLATVETETNAEGFYSLAAIPGEYHLEVAGSGAGHSDVPTKFSFSTRTFQLSTNEKRNLTLPVTSTVTVEVIVAGEPVREALVTLPEYHTGTVNLGGFETTRIGQTGQVATGADGSAHLPIFTGSTRISISGGAHGRVEFPGEEGKITDFIGPTPITEDIDLLVPTPTIVQLTGTIRSAGGEPIPGVAVTISGKEAVIETETNAEGFYSLTTVPGEYDVEVEGHGHGLPTTWSFGGGINLGRDQKRNIDLPATSTFTAEVLGAHGTPVNGATVSIPSYFTATQNFEGLTTFGIESLLPARRDR